jgi:hypothetical protein
MTARLYNLADYRRPAMTLTWHVPTIFGWMTVEWRC